MFILVQIIGALAFLFGLAVLFSARSAIHEILAAISMLIFTVSVGFSALIAEIKKGREEDKLSQLQAAQKEVEARVAAMPKR